MDDRIAMRGNSPLSIMGEIRPGNNMVDLPKEQEQEESEMAEA